MWIRYLLSHPCLHYTFPSQYTFSTMLIHLMPKYLRSLISVQHARCITHRELMSREIKGLSVGGTEICVLVRRENCLNPSSVISLGLTGKLSLPVELLPVAALFWVWGQPITGSGRRWLFLYEVLYFISYRIPKECVYIYIYI